MLLAGRDINLRAGALFNSFGRAQYLYSAMLCLKTILQHLTNFANSCAISTKELDYTSLARLMKVQTTLVHALVCDMHE